MLGYIILGILHGLLGAMIILLMGQPLIVAFTFYTVIGSLITLLYSYNDFRAEMAELR